LTRAAAAEEEPAQGEWLCDVHRTWDHWMAGRLREFDTPEANTPPPDSPRAIAARHQYGEKVRQVLARGEYVSEALFPYGGELKMDDPSREVPTTVGAAHAFYTKAVTDQDFGSVRVHVWELDGAALYLVRCVTDGSDGWLELYGADGTPLGYARTDWGCPVWKCLAVRRAAFAGDSPEVRHELAAAVQRLRGQG
jgi:hypothetical protein